MALVKVETVRTVTDYVASRVEDRTDADLIVFVTDSHGMSFRKDEVWSYVEGDGESNVKIFWDELSTTSDLKIYFTNDLGVAGWVTEHPLKGKLLTA